MVNCTIFIKISHQEKQLCEKHGNVFMSDMVPDMVPDMVVIVVTVWKSTLVVQTSN